MDKYADTLKPKEEEQEEEDRDGKKNEGIKEKGRDKRVPDTVFDTVSTPIPKNMAFALRDKIAALRLDRQELTEKVTRMKARGETRDSMGYALKDTEMSIEQIDRNIRVIFEANR